MNIDATKKSIEELIQTILKEVPEDKKHDILMVAAGMALAEKKASPDVAEAISNS